ncbi:MAG: M43 family zinc metalloprotease [Bacteroidia bacterium]
MEKKLLSLILVLVGFNWANAQHKTCGTDEYAKQVANQYPHTETLRQQLETQYQDFIDNKKLYKTSNGTRYVIPVVVHVMYHQKDKYGDFSNVHDSSIYEQIQALNKDFRRVGFRSDGEGAVDMQIEFELAKKDPQGNCHSGINRVLFDSSYRFSHRDSVKNYAMKRMSHWPSNKYLNLYVIGKFKTSTIGTSTFPWHTGNAHLDTMDGIVIEYRVFGYSGNDYSGLGKTATHEVGHWLGLYHIFQDSCANDNCLAQGDRVCDTPPHRIATYTSDCFVKYNDCQTDDDDTASRNPFRPKALGGLGDQTDMIQNYMDYSSDWCVDRFTQGQFDRCKFFLETYRKNIWQDNNMLSTGTKGLLHDFDSVGLKAQFNGKVTAMVEYNDKLLIGGDFTLADGMPCHGLVTWNGTRFDTLRGAPHFDGNNRITCMAVYGYYFYVGGTFTFQGEYSYLVKGYSNGNFQKVTRNKNVKATSNPVRALCVYKNKLYVGGDFGQVNGDSINANRIATVDHDGKWERLGTPTLHGLSGNSSACYAMTVYNGQLIIGGRFTSATGKTVDKIVSWNGSSFTSLNTGSSPINVGSVNALGAYQGKLFAGGDFVSVGGVNAPYLGIYDGTTWKQANIAGNTGMNLQSIEVFNGYVWVGGDFSSPENTVHHLFNYDVTTGVLKSVAKEYIGMGGPVLSMLQYKNQLYIGGQYDLYRGVTGNLNKIYNNISRVKAVCINSPVSVDEINSKTVSVLTLFPNPASSGITARVDDNTWNRATKKEMYVFDISGRILKNINFNNSPEVNFDISDLAPGIYFVRYCNVAKKFVKQ